MKIITNKKKTKSNYYIGIIYESLLSHHNNQSPTSNKYERNCNNNEK